MIKFTLEDSERVIEISDNQIPDEEEFLEWFWQVSYYDMISGALNNRNKSEYFGNNIELCLTYMDVFYAMEIYDYYDGVMGGWNSNIYVEII